jgi:ribonuclease D
LGPVFANPDIEKVFHAAEYDLITMKRDFGFEFANLFDTMLAARILGWKEIGLGSILKNQFGVQLNKRYQRANWGRRPLPPELLSYARLDTHYLIPLRDRMQVELERSHRWDLAKEDFRRLRYVNGKERDGVQDTCWRISGAYDLNPREAAVLLELCRYRDDVARSINRPLFKVMSDRTLLSIASTVPQNLHELRERSQLSEKQVKRYGDAVLRAVQRGLRAAPAYPPRAPRPDEDYLARVDALRYWRKKRAQNMGVNSDVVLPRDLLYKIASKSPGNEEELSQILHRVPWRNEQFGGEILDVLAST